MNPTKFELREPHLTFMSHVIGADGIRPDPEKIEAVLNMPDSTDVSNTRRFLGVINYVAKFVPHVTTVIRPIQTLVSKDILWHWGPERPHERELPWIIENSV